MFFRPITFSLFFFIALFAQAQVPRLSDKPDQFITDAQTALAATRNPAAIQIGTDLATHWNGGRFNPAQQIQIIGVSRALAGKGYRTAPHFVQWFETLNRAVEQNLSLDEYLTTSQKFLTGTDAKTGQRYLETVRNLLTNRLLYASNSNKLYASGGAIAFRFSEQPVSPGTAPADSAKVSQPTPPAGTPTGTIKLADDAGWGLDEKESPKDNDGWGDAPLSGGSVDFSEPAPTLAAGALLELKGVTLAIVTAHDSLVVANATATMGFKEGLLLGSAGQVSWPDSTTGGFGKSGTTVALNRYRIEVKNPKLSASEAILTKPDLLAAPVGGAYEFQSKKRSPRVPASFPRFASTEANASFKNLGDDLEYRGGVAFIGPKVYAVAGGRQPATFTIRKNGKVAFITRANRFDWSDSLLNSPNASLTAYLTTGDTLTHPAIRLRYDRKKQELHTNRLSRGGYRTAPFADSYHAMFINADALNWSLGSQRIDFYTVSAKNEVPVRLESFDFFDKRRYAALSGSYGFHPLTALAAYFRQRGGRQEAVVSDLGPFFKRTDANLREALMEMVQQSYLSYDPVTDVIGFSKKGRHYVQAFAGKEDYDTFVILSTFGSSAKDSLTNVSLNLANNQLTIRGAERFQVSDSLKIFMTPSDKQVVMGKNRDFTFNGEMKLDNYRFAGRNLSFNYEKFFVKLDKVDSVKFVPQLAKGKQNAPEIGGDLQYAGGGTVFLGKAGNKSGKASNIPRLVVPGGAKIYFDQPDREGGVYSRKIYFQIPNLDYDSLTSRDIRFEGTFHSDGIFAPFKATLISMPDNTLGFNHKATGSYPAYGGTSSVKLTGPLKMDRQGLHGAGELLQNGAVLPSKDLRFYPDSVVAIGASGSLVAGGKAQLPAATFKDYVLKWQPKKDSLLLTNRSEAFDFYGGTTKLNGRLLLQAAGLFGQGVVQRKDSQTESERFRFTKDQFTAEAAELRIGTNLTNGGKAVLVGTDMDVNFNVATGNAVIQKPKTSGFNPDSSFLEFPVAAYRTSITRADWNTIAKTITMKGDPKTSVFSSLAPDQEGLRFNAAEAVYDMEKMTLNLRGVAYVQSADARIYPAKGQLVIRQDAAIQPLTKARIVLDTLNGYHTLSEGNVRIVSKSRFEGSATYLYVRTPGDTSRLKMSNFDIKESGGENATASRNKRAAPPTGAKTVLTTAAASITETDKFFLTPRLQYRGEVTMRSPEKKLVFNGDVRLNLKSRPDQTAWIAFNNADSDDVNIRVDEKLRGDGQPLYAGLHFRRTSSGLYTTFVSPKEAAADPDVFLATGPLTDVPKTSQLVVSPGSGEKTSGVAPEGNQFILDDAKKIVNLRGRFNLFQPANYVQAAGLARIHPDSAKYQFNTLLALDFPLPVPVLTAMGDKLVQTNLDEKNTDPAEPDAERLLTKLSGLVGSKVANAYADKAAGGYLPLPTTIPALNKALVLSNVSLRWSDDNSAFYSVGKIGVSNVGGVDINATLDGYLELRKNPGSNDELFVYLEASPDVWYYFGFRQDQLGLVSSDGSFNNAVNAQTKQKTKGTFLFTPVAEDEKVLFLERFEQTYKIRSNTKTAAKPVAKAPAAKPSAVPAAPAETANKAESVPDEFDAAVPAKVAKTASKKSDKAVAKKDVKKPVAKKPIAKDSAVVAAPTAVEEPVRKKAEEKKTGF